MVLKLKASDSKMCRTQQQAELINANTTETMSVQHGFPSEVLNYKSQEELLDIVDSPRQDGKHSFQNSHQDMNTTLQCRGS